MAKKTRMYEPWGYREENNYQGNETIIENDLASFFADVSYNRDDNKIHFKNKDGQEVGILNVDDFVKSDQIVERAWYEGGKIYIKFTNGDLVTIDVKELIDENEFKDGLQVNDGTVTVLIDQYSDKYLSVSTNGVKVAGVEADIEAEKTRAEGEETRIEEKLDAEISRAETEEQRLDSKLDAEISRAISAETRIENNLNSEIQRAKDSETVLDSKIDSLNAELDAEESIREAKDVELNLKIEKEISDRTADVNEEETRSKAAEQDLQAAIDAETDRATSAETYLEVILSGKADADVIYTQEEVDALLSAKETEIYNLTKIVGDMGGAVTYELPGPSNKSFNTLMSNNGTVKITDDVTTGRFGPGITAKNKVNLNLNTYNLTVTGLTTSSAQPAIMSRGTQEITIYGKGIIDAGGGVCIEANGKDSIINLTGSTTVYQTDRPGAELIYCYAGTINITNGTFKNNGSPYLLNCYDANYNNGTAKIIVTGGKFYDFNPADNSAEGEHTSFVPEGYHVETSTVIEEEVEHTVYTVKKDV